MPMDQRDALLLCSNILSNAIRHSPNGGSIWIAVTADAQMIQLTVQDQGKGIAEEDRPHLFEPFYRGDASRSRKSGGTGLGLSICNAICQRAGGSIDIANSVTGGAIVTVKVPSPHITESLAHSASLKAK